MAFWDKYGKLIIIVGVIVSIITYALFIGLNWDCISASIYAKVWGFWAPYLFLLVIVGYLVFFYFKKGVPIFPMVETKGMKLSLDSTISAT